MRKENLVSSNSENSDAYLTRARAASLRTAGQIGLSKSLAQQEQKRVSRAYRKRPLGVSIDVPCNPALQRKKRPAFTEITNISCESSYKSGFNASKVQAKNGKRSKIGPINVSKVVPEAANGLSNLQADYKEITFEENTVPDPISQIISSASLKESLSPGIHTSKKCAVEDNFLSGPSSGVPSQPQCHSRKGGKCTYSWRFTESSEPEYVNIDSDLIDPQLCSLYAPDIYENLRVAELAHRPCPDFMEALQRDISQNMRGILVDWLVEVSEEYKLVPDSLYLTVYLIDWFLSRNFIERQRLQLLGITCMLIASKYEEICAPRVEEFCFITDNTYTREEVLKMETRVLKHFGFQIFIPTSKTFLRRFLRAAQASYQSQSLELEYLANYLAELALVDYNFLKFLPSIIAASAVFLSKWTLDHKNHPWNSTLEHYTTYKASHLKTSVVALQDLQLNTSGCPLNAVRTKYRQQKYKSVAALSSQKLVDTLFF